MEYKKLSEITPAGAFTSAAKVLVIDNGEERLVPVTALVSIDRAITSRDQLPATAAVGESRWFVSARDSLEGWEFRADGKWRQIL